MMKKLFLGAMLFLSFGAWAQKKTKLDPATAQINDNKATAIMALNNKADVQIESPWKAAAERELQGSDTEQLPKANPFMRDFNAEGKMVNPDQPLHDVGMQVGISVIRRQDKLLGTISFLGDPSNDMTQDGQAIEVPISKLLEDWKPMQTQQAKNDEEELCTPDLKRCIADRAHSFQIMVHKQKVIQEIHQLSVKYPIHVESC
jgi:hypothetical protein